MAKYGKAASKTVESVMHRQKKGKLKSGSGKKVTSRKQAIAIALSEAREKGAKVPPPPGARKTSRTGSRKSVATKGARKTAAKTATSRKKTASSTRKTGAKKTGARKSPARKAARGARKL
jgi:hypothetical protein